MGHLLTSWTIRISLLLFAGSIGMFVGDLAKRRPHWLRGLWTSSYLLFVVHVMCAFHFHHHWSHQSALDDTARQTKALMGWAFGEGIYFSYLFLFLWGADVLWSWRDLPSYFSRPKFVHGAILGYLVFIAFNGAVVFEGGPTRIGGIIAALLLGAIILRRYSSRPIQQPSSLQDQLST